MSFFEQGDVVRVPFPYTDRSVRQFRPALVVSEGGIGDRAELLWVVMITSAENRSWSNDIALGATFAEAGLPAPSIIRGCKVATIEAQQAERIGSIAPDLLREVVRSMAAYLGVGTGTAR